MPHRRVPHDQPDFRSSRSSRFGYDEMPSGRNNARWESRRKFHLFDDDDEELDTLFDDRDR